jgi:hypothetical protein
LRVGIAGNEMKGATCAEESVALLANHPVVEADVTKTPSALLGWHACVLHTNRNTAQLVVFRGKTFSILERRAMNHVDIP